MSLASAAARLPWPVFACDGEKKPLVKWRDECSRDNATIHRQFDHPSAAMIGVPTGRASGLVVIDVDVKNGARGKEWLDENQYALPETRTHRTRSGGLHLVFLAPADLDIRNSASRVAPGVDVRGEGGYAIFPPSPGYAVADDHEPAEMPVWLMNACLREEAPRPVQPASEARHERYVQAALDAEALAVSRAGEGARNDTLHKAAVKLGTLVGAGVLSRSDAEAELTRAGQGAGLPYREIIATVKSGLDYGESHPREIPEKPPIIRNQNPPPDMPDDPGYWESVYTAAAEAVEVPEDHEPAAPDEPREAPPFPATPLNGSELNHIPPRELVYGHFLFRKFISALGAPGGSGKTAYAFAVALAIATGRDLLGEGVHDTGPVWIYNLEDPRTELLRRFKAAMLGHKVAWSEVEGRIYLDSGRDRPLVIAKATRDGTVIAWPQVPSLIAEIKARGIRVLIVDPFVRSHRVEENVNDQIDFVAALWAQIADAADCSIFLVHHFKKGGTSGDAAAFRGASALIDASRAAVTLATMSSDEAKGMGVEEKTRWRYVRADNAKLNLAPPPDSATWLELEGVDIGNGTSDRPSDKVQTVVRWEPPNAFDDLPIHTVTQILTALQHGPGNGEQYYLTGGTSERWAGHVVRQIAGKNEGEAKRIIAVWKRNGVVENARYYSPALRRDAAGMTVNMAAVAKMGR